MGLREEKKINQGRHSCGDNPGDEISFFDIGFDPSELRVKNQYSTENIPCDESRQHKFGTIIFCQDDPEEDRKIDNQCDRKSTQISKNLIFFE